MNRIERSILGPLVKSICRHNKHLWWELKHQIWSSGYQAFYPRQSEYEDRVRAAINSLDMQSWKCLKDEWQKSNPEEGAHRERMRRYYEDKIIKEIVRRAAIAAYRTVEW